MKKAALLLALLLLCFASWALALEDDPVIVSAGDVSYRLSEVQATLDAYLQEYRAQAGYIEPEEAQLMADSVLESFADRAVLENKCRVLGLDTLTAQEEATLRAEADILYAQLVDEAAAQIAGAYQTTVDAARATAAATLAMQGYTSESLYHQIRMQWQDQRLLAHVAGDIDSVPEEAILEAYQVYYVEPCKQAYAHDIPAYEGNTVINGDPSYYIPEGYRLIKQIKLPFSEDIGARMAEAIRALNAAYANAGDAEDRLSKVLAANGDATEAQAAYDQLALVFYEKENTYNALKRSAMVESQLLLAEIEVAIEAGADFDSLIAQYSTGDTQTVPVHASSILYADEFTEAAMALQAAGDASAPFATGEGIHILYYDSDLAGGEVPLSDALHEEIEELLIVQARYEVLETLLPEWRAEYAVYTDGALLRISE